MSKDAKEAKAKEERERKERRGPQRASASASVTLTPVVPEVPDALRVVEVEEGLPGLPRWFQGAAIVPLALFRDEDLRAVGMEWTRNLVREAQRQRQESGPEAEKAREPTP